MIVITIIIISLRAITVNHAKMNSPQWKRTPIHIEEHRFYYFKVV